MVEKIHTPADWFPENTCLLSYWALIALWQLYGCWVTILSYFLQVISSVLCSRHISYSLFKLSITLPPQLSEDHYFSSGREKKKNTSDENYPKYLTSLRILKKKESLYTVVKSIGTKARHSKLVSDLCNLTRDVILGKLLKLSESLFLNVPSESPFQ